MFHRQAYYNPSIQVAAMKIHYPQFKSFRKGSDVIEFIGELIVKPTFPAYIVSVTYNGESRPLVRIVKPKLVENPPHFFKKSDSLCLYHPKNFRWAMGKLIAKDIMSWTAAWIYFYEVWLRTDKWYGPSAGHDLDVYE